MVISQPWATPPPTLSECWFEMNSFSWDGLFHQIVLWFFSAFFWHEALQCSFFAALFLLSHWDWTFCSLFPCSLPPRASISTHKLSGYTINSASLSERRVAWPLLLSNFSFFFIGFSGYSISTQKFSSCSAIISTYFKKPEYIKKKNKNKTIKPLKTPSGSEVRNIPAATATIDSFVACCFLYSFSESQVGCHL